jgi:hypothetical protein
LAARLAALPAPCPVLVRRIPRPAGTVLSLGTHILTATFTPTNTTNCTSGTVSRQITVVIPCLTRTVRAV